MNMYSNLTKILSFILITTSVGCTSIIKSSSDIKWSGQNTGINEKMENAGYYKIGPFSKYAFIFYDDGTLVLSDVPKDKTEPDSQSSSLGLKQWGPFYSIYDRSLDRWDLGQTGLYRIEGDTIYANLYFRNCFHFSSRFRLYFETYMWKLKFHIKDKTTIHWIDVHTIDKEFPYPESVDKDLFFLKEEQLPPPNTEMKKKRWLWKDKN